VRQKQAESALQYRSYIPGVFFFYPGTEIDSLLKGRPEVDRPRGLGAGRRFTHKGVGSLNKMVCFNLLADRDTLWFKFSFLLEKLGINIIFICIFAHKMRGNPMEFKQKPNPKTRIWMFF